MIVHLSLVRSSVQVFFSVSDNIFLPVLISLGGREAQGLSLPAKPSDFVILHLCEDLTWHHRQENEAVYGIRY